MQAYFLGWGELLVYVRNAAAAIFDWGIIDFFRIQIGVYLNKNIHAP